MNRIQQRFTLYLIKKEIRKAERAAFKKISKENSNVRRKAKLGDYVEDPHWYRGLIDMRNNIASINNPWQGTFAPYWTRSPKNKKHIKDFEDYKSVYPIEVPLKEEDTRWAKMTRDEFYEALDNEDIK